MIWTTTPCRQGKVEQVYSVYQKQGKTQ